jgi:signal transduction histidine kinase
MEEKMDWKTRGSLMIVDDVESEIDILVDTLGQDYEVCVATDGESALELAMEISPDLILLDVLMPGIDGYEVCRRLKNNSRTRNIAIIFVTVLGEEGHEATGLDLGALDYITKPFNVDIVKARVRNHMNLIEAGRLKEDVNRIMHHDMRNALSSIVGYPEILLLEGGLNDRQIQTLEKISSAGYALSNMVNLGIQMYKMECGSYKYRPAMVDAAVPIRRILNGLSPLAEQKNIHFDFRLAGTPIQPGNKFEIRCEDLLFYSMISNLITNAVEAAPAGSTVTVDMRKEDTVSISIHNMGVVPETIRGRFFEKYATEGKPSGTGLGTYSAKLMAEAHGGDIEMRTSETDGTTVTVRLPA